MATTKKPADPRDDPDARNAAGRREGDAGAAGAEADGEAGADGGAGEERDVGTGAEGEVGAGVTDGAAGEAIAGLRDGFVDRARDLWRRLEGPAPTHWHTRFVFLRFLGLVYTVAFLILVNQLLPLVGKRGLLPVGLFLDAVVAHFGSRGDAIFKLPTLFWISASDSALMACAWIGLALAIALLLGVTNAFVQIALWAIYLSFVQVGQIFYGYGWETLLLETGFLSIFLCPLWSAHPYPREHRPPVAVIWLLRWLALRVMLGAGLIKLRGDPCWRDLTCLLYHYETQPNPNPLSYWLHHLPAWFHKGGVLFNHVVELIAPFLAFGPRPARNVAGVLLVAFQLSLIASGNLSFLNWLTLTVCLACFDDRFFARLLPARLSAIAKRAGESPPPPRAVARARRGVIIALVVLVAFLSLGPVSNMLSPSQAMNASFEPLHLVNTYGAFGSVGRERYEVVIEGTRDASPDEGAAWLAYELPCKPGDLARRPCVITPYHYRLDWQMWFAAMSRIEREPWLVHLVYKLLKADRGVRGLFAVDPFGDKPPKYIRAELYIYSFTKPGEPDAEAGAWWRRTRVGEYMRPIALDDPDLSAYVEGQGWASSEQAP